MRLTLRREGENRGWPNYLLWGRMRTSTFVLIVAFLGTWWLYETYRPPTEVPTEPATQVVPPGFVPDPEYTWVPRTKVQTPTTTTETTTPTDTPTETSPTDTPTETAPTAPNATTTGPVPTPTPLAPGVAPQTTAENRSGTPTTTAAPGPAPSATPPQSPQ
jgi:hypothetical protein